MTLEVFQDLLYKLNSVLANVIPGRNKLISTFTFFKYQIIIPPITISVTLEERIVIELKSL
ncbi:MAG: hypothetical protein ACFFKA_14140 [Candidatus Thorarchaeota archaeon]